MSSTSTINHADASNLTSDQDWATLNSDGSLPSNFPTSNGDTTIAKMGTPIHTSCCPSGTVEFLSEKKEESASYEGCCDAVTATLLAMQKKMSTHAPKFLLLTGSLRADSCSRKVAIEVGRVLASYGADVKLFDATDLPLFSQDIDPKSNAKAMELRTLTRWCEGMVWISPEVHGNMSAVFKNQVDWMPLTEGAIRPTHTTTVNNLRVLGRWMRMIVIPNQSSIPVAYTKFNEDGTLKEGPLRSRVVDVVDELFRYTLLLRDQQPFLLERYSENTALNAKRHLEETKTVQPEVIKSLVDPIIIDVRSEKEVAEEKGGKAIDGSYHVPLNMNNEPQSVHITTSQEFYTKLIEAGIDMKSLSKMDTNFIVHCTKGNTEYTGRCNRGSALLRDLGFVNAHNGGSADEIRLALSN